MSSLKPDPIYALVDCNNFYCSCERVFNPALEKKPMAVLSNNDGCIVARSNEIKALGIPMGAPMFQYKKLWEQKKSNYSFFELSAVWRYVTTCNDNTTSVHTCHGSLFN